jgi:hypothetical protein
VAACARLALAVASVELERVKDDRARAQSMGERCSALLRQLEMGPRDGEAGKTSDDLEKRRVRGTQASERLQQLLASGRPGAPAVGESLDAIIALEDVKPRSSYRASYKPRMHATQGMMSNPKVAIRGINPASYLPSFLWTVHLGNLPTIQAKLTVGGSELDRLAPYLNWNALHIAAQGRSVDVFTTLARWRPQLLGQPDSMGRTPLHYLANQALGWPLGRPIRGEFSQPGRGLLLEEVLGKVGGAELENLLHLPDNRGNTVLGLDVLRMAQAGAERGVLKARMAQLHDRSDKDVTLRPEALGAAELLVRHGLNQALALLLEAKPLIDLSARWESLTGRLAHAPGAVKRRAADDGPLTFSDPPFRDLPPATGPSSCLLGLAVKAGHFVCVELLLSKHAKPQAQDLLVYYGFLRGE